MFTKEDGREAVREATGAWWWFVVAGVAWLLIALLALRFDATSLVTVGALLGALFLVASADEFFIAWVRRSWRWAHVLLGILFVAGAMWAFIRPIEAFWALAAVFGLLLVLRGTLDIVASAASRVVNPMWGFGLAVGILEILLGFWASQQYFPAQAALVLVWVGFFAMLRGLSSIFLGFEIRGFGHDVDKWSSESHAARGAESLAR
jgi:uncharacterized membrane protein HdeD (DUF308 family)